ncbi:hypothetical protein PR202_ga00202 [Eleusine coracana subsp. coracana]|uniref:Reverse transcriptase zinc-binding domain-containing protein n=1 Tax=Eleusine coracana subsp. coracana TaxID=191504 RepID=A0AAV5BGF3_ELECO|nr:hypothetical protein PR202_ga00202 [Eleusine coracana subsp. coracana]
MALSTPTLELALQSRLTRVAEEELDDLRNFMQDVHLQADQHDYRVMRNNGKTPTSAQLHSMEFQQEPVDAFATSIWDNFVPPKCKFFLWLTHHRRLNTKDRLYRHNMGESAQCPFCLLPEDTEHLFLHCARVASFWTSIRVPPPAVVQIESLWDTIPELQSMSSKIRSTFLTCFLWNIWKCRNSKVFRHEDESNLTIARRIHEDLALWSHRCTKSHDRSLLMSWSNRIVN